MTNATEFHIPADYRGDCRQSSFFDEETGVFAIASDVRVGMESARTLGDNEKQCDERMTCSMALDVTGEWHWVFVETNGDPVVVGSVEDGKLEADPFFSPVGEDWLIDILKKEFGWEPQ